MSSVSLRPGAATRAPLLLVLFAMTGCAVSPEAAPPPPVVVTDRTLPAEQAPGQVVDPDVERPDLSPRAIEAQDYEVGVYASSYAVTRDIVAVVYGARGAYHLSPELFVEAQYSTASSSYFDKHGDPPGDDGNGDLDYDSLSMSLGYNMLPGALYVTKSYTLPIAFYGVAGIGNVNYEDDAATGYHVGLGLKVLPLDWMSLRFELRDQAWYLTSLDHHIEFSIGLGVFF